MPVTITIELKDNGQIMVSGPLKDKVLCYGLLESAKDVVREQAAAEAKKTILAPHPLINLNANRH